MTGRAKKHYVAIQRDDGDAAVYELDPNFGFAAYRLWLDDLSLGRALEVATAMNALESQRSKDRRAEAARRRARETR